MLNQMKKSLIYITLFLIASTSYGQKQSNIWYFGNNAGVDFNTVSPSALLNGQTNSLEGTAVIADSSGSLLFYSDGVTVWNKNHQVMLNGTNLLGNPSSTQSSIVIPEPSNPNRYYYLLTVNSGFDGGNIGDGLRYSKIDICLDNSKGGIISNEKNIKIVDTVAEKITVTRHSNGIDYWILTHKFYSNEFWAVRLSSSGFVETVISAIGSTHTGDIAGSQGQLKFSGNGEKIAIAASNGLDLLEIFDFNKTTGVVSNFQPLSRINNGSVYGVEFSQDGSKLYAVSSSFSPFGMDVSQYDLNAGSLTAINSSLSSIYNEPAIIARRGLQIGTDGKIYMISLSNDYYLATINNTNAIGVGCDFQDQSISLSGKKGNYTLPSFIAGFDYSNSLITCSTANVLENKSSADLTIYPNPFSDQTILESDVLLINATLIIEDCFGKTVKRIGNIFGETISLKREGLSSGFYFIHLIQDNKIIATKKIIIAD